VPPRRQCASTSPAACFWSPAPPPCCSASSAVGVNFAGFAILLLGPFLLPHLATLTPAESGVILAVSPLGMVLAAPLADRIAARIGMANLIRLGLAGTALGLAIMGFAGGLALFTAGMFVQGIGQGLFQVGNFDEVTGALPARDRGVAGSLALLTRTFGLMLGATLLMLLMQTLALHASPADAIAGVYRIVALIPLALLSLGLKWRRK
jgi:MFS family permease